MESKKSPHHIVLAELALLIMVVIWGSSFVVIKEHLAFVDPVAMLLYRFGVSAILIGLILVLQRKNPFHKMWPGFLVGFFLWLVYLPQNLGLMYTSASNSGFITGLFIAFVPLFSIFFFKVRPNVVRLFAAVVSLAGLWLLTRGYQNMNLGDLITVLSALGFAFYILFSEKFLKNNKKDPFIFLFQQFIAVTVLSLVMMLVLDLPFAVTSTNTYYALLYLSIFATTLTFMVYIYVQKNSSSMQAALILALVPVFTAIFAHIFGGETFGFRQLLGGGLIVLAMIISELPLEQIWQKKSKNLADLEIEAAGKSQS